jgi:predicted enzyme related to lactoylglutathione lyase
VARFHVDGVLFELVPASDPAVLSGRGNARLTLAVDQVEAAAAELRAQGVPVSEVHEMSNGRFVSLTDPDGNEIVLWQYE